VPDIASFCGKQTVHKVIPLGMVRQQIGEICLSQLKEAFIVPQRVVSIESNDGQLVFHYDYVLLALFSGHLDVI
jgi:hypothetical protein